MIQASSMSVNIKLNMRNHVLGVDQEKYMAICAIWYHLYNFKNAENFHRGVILLVKLQAQWVFSSMDASASLKMRRP